MRNFKLILSILGFLNAIYLTSLKVVGSSVCVVGSNCGAVINSAYSTFFSVPVSVFGISFFLSLFYVYQKKVFSNVHYYIIEFSLLLIGLFFSLWFVFVQAFLVKSFCFFCTVSALIVFTLFILTIVEIIKLKNSTQLSLLPTLNYCIVVFLLLITPILLSKGTQNLLNYYDISISNKIFASTKMGNITFNQLKNQAGNSYISQQIKNHEQNINYVIEILLQKEAQYFNLPIGAYYQIFMDYNLDLENSITRKKLLSFSGNSNQINYFLSSKEKLDRKNSKDRYLEFRQKLLRFYDVQVLSDLSHLKTNILPNPYGGITIGSKDAPIHVVVFSDFLCSHCATFHNEIEELLKENPNLLKVDFRNFPHVNSTSRNMAKLASCAGKQNKYIPVANIFYKNQEVIYEKNKAFSLNELVSYLPEDVNISDIKKCFNSYEVMNLIQGDLNEVSKLKINSTPTVYVNGYLGDVSTILAEISKEKINNSNEKY